MRDDGRGHWSGAANVAGETAPCQRHCVWENREHGISGISEAEKAKAHITNDFPEPTTRREKFTQPSHEARLRKARHAYYIAAVTITRARRRKETIDGWCRTARASAVSERSLMGYRVREDVGAPPPAYVLSAIPSELVNAAWAAMDGAGDSTAAHVCRGTCAAPLGLGT